MPEFLSDLAISPGLAVALFVVFFLASCAIEALAGIKFQKGDVRRPFGLFFRRLPWSALKTEGVYLRILAIVLLLVSLVFLTRVTA